MHINDDGDLPGFAAVTICGLYPVAGGGAALRARSRHLRRGQRGDRRRRADHRAVRPRVRRATRAPIPSLLLTSAVHHHLIREKTRTRVGLVVEAGDVREVHHVALLVGYGAPRSTPTSRWRPSRTWPRTACSPASTPTRRSRNLIKALGKGVLKVMSKMGISTVASYPGAQVFEALGLAQELVDEYFTGTASRLGGIGLDVIAEEVAARHARAYPRGGAPAPAHRRLEVGGEYQWRREGEVHLFNPETVFLLQHATRARQYDVFKEYTAAVDEQSERLMTLRGLFRFGRAAPGARRCRSTRSSRSRRSCKRFTTGAMSYGSISQEAHETLAIAMNRLGGKSNTGEGGEDADRLLRPERRSAVKQVASGRFGVTSEYLVNADDLQIKMAQGAKPGEGGQLPGQQGLPVDRAGPGTRRRASA